MRIGAKTRKSRTEFKTVWGGEGRYTMLLLLLLLSSSNGVLYIHHGGGGGGGVAWRGGGPRYCPGMVATRGNPSAGRTKHIYTRNEI